MNDMKQRQTPVSETLDEPSRSIRIVDRIMLYLFVGLFALFGALLLGELLASLLR